MTRKISPRMVKSFEKFNADLDAFILETEDDFATLYENPFTTRYVKNFSLSENGKLTWVEDGGREEEQMFDDDDARDWLSFWRANLRRARRYWAMETDTLDKIQDGEIADPEE